MIYKTDRIQLSASSRDSKGRFIKGHSVDTETRNKMSIAKKENPVRYWLGKPLPDEKKEAFDRTGRTPWNKGKKLNYIPKMAFGYGRKVYGANSFTWKGGITPINKIIRHSKRYAKWRLSVFQRDNYSCVNCGVKGYIEADHIKSFAFYPDLRFEVSNGRTLCLDCHKITPNYKKRKDIYDTA
jgi:hypothetical protein